MFSKVYSAYFFTFLIGSTLCVSEGNEGRQARLIPEGEYQIGPLFGGPGNNRFLGNKHFEAFFDKGAIKPLLAKKVLLGVGVVGAGALAVGAAELWKKHQQKNHGGGGGWGKGYGNQGWSKGYENQGWSNNYDQGSSNGYYPATGDNQYQYGQAQAQQQAYPSYNYQDQSGYNYQDQSNANSYSDSSYNYGGYTGSGYSQ